MLAWSAGILSRRSGRAIAAWTGAGMAALFGLSVAAEALFFQIFAIVPALIAVAAVTAMAATRHVWSMIQFRRTHDAGTDLPNRFALDAFDGGGGEVAIAVAVVQGFDRLAAVVGADGANVLMARVAERLRFASDSATVYRIDDRALAWVVDGPDTARKARLDAIGGIMLDPVEVRGRRVDVALACGLAVGARVDAVVNDAMLAASEAGSAGVPWQLAATDQEDLAQQISLMGELSDALDQGQLEVAYQPKLDIAGDAITSVEALVRWRHPVRGYLRPDFFVPLAEQSDRILGLTLFVLERTMRDLAWSAAQGRTLRGAVNISATLVTSAPFASGVDALLAKNIIPTSQLIFEVTETADPGHAADAAAALGTFREMGIAISMDDYGTGQSTLSYIKNLPLCRTQDRSVLRPVCARQQRRRGAGLLDDRSCPRARPESRRRRVEDEACLTFLREDGMRHGAGLSHRQADVPRGHHPIAGPDPRRRLTARRDGRQRIDDVGKWRARNNSNVRPSNS